MPDVLFSRQPPSSIDPKMVADARRLTRIINAQMTQKLYIQTNGCQMNEYDSDKMRDVLQASHGFELINDPKQADVLLLNTCSIREKAQEKVFSALGKWRIIKEKRPDIIRAFFHFTNKPRRHQ